MSAKHPARFSREILDVLRIELSSAPWVHDPFAGTGERLGALCDELGVGFSGTELEAPFIVDRRVHQGDSRDRRTYGIEPGRFWIVTSPVYPNGMADHFKPRDASRRFTYRAAAIELSGDPDYALHEANMGRYSVRAGAKAERTYWELAAAVIDQWHQAERAIVNVKDFTTGERYVDVTGGWRLAMACKGWHLVRRHDVPCPGMRHGANGNVRVDTEAVLVFDHVA
jgi:hypothetical protein